MIEHAICLVEHVDVFRIVPTRAAGAVRRGKEPEKSKGIHIVSAPESDREALVVQIVSCRQERLELHTSERHRNPKVLFPLRLYELCHRLVGRIGIEKILDFLDRKSLTLKTSVSLFGYRKSRFAQQLPRLFGIEALAFRLRVTHEDSFRSKRR